MKILLLTDIPPCKNFTAGLVLDQLCRFLPRGSLACFAMVNPHIDAKLSPDLDWIPIAYGTKRSEVAFRPLPNKFSFPIAWITEKLRRRFVVPRLAEQVIDFGRAQNVDVVWAVLQGQTVTQIAPYVADKLNARLITQVWDPLIWWLLANNIDRFNRHAALADFDEAVRRSRTCITASWAMAKNYETRYGTRSIPVIASHPADWARAPDLSQFPRDEIKIGMAGQFYAGAEWMQLLRALNHSGWQVRGRPVSVTVLGGGLPPGEVPADRVHFLGWRSQHEAAEILSEMDLLYCPYPFDQHMDEVARLSFPSKVVLYLVAGRPILFHGPSFASPAEYLRDREAGLIVPDVHAAAIYNALCRIVDDPTLYATLGRNAQRAFRRDFTLESMRENWEQALEVSLDELVERPTEAVSPVNLPDVTDIFPGSARLYAAVQSVVRRLRQMSRAAALPLL
jgi:glycosyltransferase involved in cell wall biosynthesis